MRRKLRIIVISILALIGGGFYFNFTSLHTEEEPFDSARWKELNEQTVLNDPGCVRGGMALSLIQQKLVIGNPKSEIADFLGEATTTHSQNEWRYGLGQCHWGWEHSSMVIKFNTRGVASDISIELEKSTYGKR